MPTFMEMAGLLTAIAIGVVPAKGALPPPPIPLWSSLLSGGWLLPWLIPVYCYLIYPRLCAWWAMEENQPAEPVNEKLPPLLVVCVFHNEREALPAKLENTLHLEYPGLEALFVSDASDDGSDEIIRAESRVTLVRGGVRRGKPASLDAVLREEMGKRPEGTVVLLTDANTILDRGAARRLAAALADPAVKFACGRLVLEKGANPFGDWERRYWDEEQVLKRGEGARGWLIGANGGLWAFRLADYPGLGTDRLVMEDLLIPLRLLADGGMGAYVVDAVGNERVAPSDRREFTRKLRIARADFSMLPLLLKLKLPAGVRFALWSHKILRWLFPLLVPLWLAAPFVFFFFARTIEPFPGHWFSVGDFLIPLGVCLLLGITLSLALLGRWFSELAGIRYAVAMNVAFLIAGIGWLVGIQPPPYWEHTRS